MKFAVVELKYVPGKTYIIPINYIKKFNLKFKQTDSFLCYISLNISDDPNFDADYYKEEFKGSAGTFKVFVIQVTNTYEDAIIFQREKRLKSLPKKFRDPANTEAEISAEQKRKRRSENKIQKINKRVAMVKNISYLSETLFNVPNDEGIMNSGCCETNDYSSDGESMTTQRINDVAVDTISDVAVDTISDVAVDTISDVNVDTVSDGIRCEAESEPYPLTVEQRRDDFEEDAMSIDPISDVQQSEDQSTVIYLTSESSSLTSSKIQKAARKVATKPQNAIDRDSYDSNASAYYIDRPNNISGAETEISIYNLGGTHQYEAVNMLSEPTNPTAINSVLRVVDDVPINSQDTIHTLNYDELLRALNQDMYVIPADQHFSGIVSSLKNGRDSASSLNITDVLPATRMERPSVSLQQKSTSGTALFSRQYEATSVIDGSRGMQSAESCDVDACCVLKKNYDDLLLENASLRKQNDDLYKRNVALQDALVSTAKTVPPVPFESKDGGRLYNGSIFINRTQCEILDKTEDHQKYLNNLALAVFGSKTLKNSSVTGSVSNNYKKPAKPMLDTQRLNIIYSLMAAKTNCNCFSRTRINQILNKKIYNLNATGKPRKNQTNQNNSDTEN